MNELEKIDNFFNGKLSEPDRRAFESDLKTDPELADAVAFYLMTRQAAKAESEAQRQAEWEAIRKAEKQKVRPLPAFIGRWVAYAGSAAAAIIIMLRIFFASPSVQQLAERSIQDSYESVSQTMAGDADSLQQAVAAFRDGRYDETLRLTKGKLQRDPTNAEALKLAGLVSLRTENYDQAITYFNRLGQQTGDFENSGVFYEALAHLKRDRPMDKNQAKQLLKMVIDNNLDGTQQAEEILSKLE